MKPLAIFLLVLCLVALAGVGWLYLNSEFDVTFSSCVAVDAADAGAQFSSLKSDLEQDCFAGTRFSDALPGDADQYQFLTYTLHLQNRTALPAQAVEVQITPRAEDVLQLNASDEVSLLSGASRDLTVTILTAKSSQNIREATITYYFWGLPFSVRITCAR